jgi:hypothetical protein
LLRLADDPAAAKVGCDPREQVGTSQQLERRSPLGFCDHDGRRFHFQCRTQRLLLQRLTLQQHPAEIGLDQLFLHPQLIGRLRDKASACPRGIQVERVHVHQLTLRDQQVDLQSLQAQVLLEPPHAVAPLTQGKQMLVLGPEHLARRRR